MAEDGTLAAMMATSRYPLPVADDVVNTDALLGHDGFVGMKTGSDDAAGGCFMFRSELPTESGGVTVIGAVLGQRGRDLIAAGLSASNRRGIGRCTTRNSPSRPKRAPTPRRRG
ncbi:hypothetical protein [Streptacidiphilus sp. EB129]|uniref:hypothetical protein n=1 Tax=Streptacidiphilus sp. EB129 TaxID=3156262 RepID=UPI0035110D1F